MAEFESSEKGSVRTSGGVVAGIVGGAALALMLAVVAAVQGGSVWGVFKFAGAPFMGERAFEPGFDALALIVGVLSHFAVSIAWGVLFSLLFFGFSKGTTVAFGLLWGLVAWATMYYIVLPIAGLGQLARQMPPGLSIVEHLVFGLFVALAFLPWQRQIPQQTYRPRITV